MLPRIVSEQTGPSRLRLSVDTLRDAGDMLVPTGRSVVSLEPGASSAGSRTATLPSTTPEGTYYVLACGDDLLKVAERNGGTTASPRPRRS